MSSTVGPGHRQTTRVRGALAVVVAMLTLLAVSCANGIGFDIGGGTTAGSTDTTVTDAIEQFRGSVDAFYVVPNPLPKGDPGSVIRTMPVDAAAGLTGLRIMYHSTDAEGDDRAVTGLVYYPTDAAPAAGWPTVAYAHGTSGLISMCAPSRKPAPPPSYGVHGVRFATDYIGLGPEGEIHPYLTAAAEGHAVIDGMRAVRSLPEVHAGTDWVVSGVSQGGHAALVTNEQAAARLPEMRLLGAVAIAPGSQLGETYGDDIQARIITTMVSVGVAAEDPKVNLDDYFGPNARRAAEAIRTKCIGDIVSTAAVLAIAPDYFQVDPRSGPMSAAWLAANDPGQVRAPTPVLLIQGGRDIVVLTARTDALMKRMCATGQVVERIDVPNGDHDTVARLAGDQIAPWVAARFAGGPAANDC